MKTLTNIVIFEHDKYLYPLLIGYCFAINISITKLR